MFIFLLEGLYYLRILDFNHSKNIKEVQKSKNTKLTFKAKPMEVQ